MSLYRFLSEGTSFIAPPASRVTVSKTLPTVKLVERNGVLVEEKVMNPVERNWCFAPNSVDARVSLVFDCLQWIIEPWMSSCCLEPENGAQNRQ